MRPFEIYRAALYNVYGGSRVTDVPYIYNNNKHNNIWIASVCIVYVGLAQARPNKPTSYPLLALFLTFQLYSRVNRYSYLHVIHLHVYDQVHRKFKYYE